MNLTITVDGIEPGFGGAGARRLIDEAVAAAIERSRQARANATGPAAPADAGANFRSDPGRR